ncbi:hypothetical protein DXG01_014915 [Tephrocybe rancida]|nr:hypothetical protein DXG01_014915 [Tephrocybe rancida]
MHRLPLSGSSADDGDGAAGNYTKVSSSLAAMCTAQLTSDLGSDGNVDTEEGSEDVDEGVVVGLYLLDAVAALLRATVGVASDRGAVTGNEGDAGRGGTHSEDKEQEEGLNASEHAYTVE